MEGQKGKPSVKHSEGPLLLEIPAEPGVQTKKPMRHNVNYYYYSAISVSIYRHKAPLLCARVTAVSRKSACTMV